jgi:arylsulfatase A-like enzyme
MDLLSVFFEEPRKRAFRRSLALAFLGLCLPLVAEAGGTSSGRAGSPNILMIVADDLGVDVVGVYQEGTQVPPTPNIDALAQRGVYFRNCWADPVCSPTRATLQTGRYSFRTGIGTIVTENGPDLSLGELILPEILTVAPNGAYVCSAIGKWHLGNRAGGGSDHANLSGYPYFNGTASNFSQANGYYSWPKIVNGIESVCTTYATTDNVDEALAWISGAPEPWFCYLAFNAPHDPYHEPPAALHTRILPPVDPREDPRAFFEAVVEAMDTEIGRLLSSIGPALANTDVIFVGDNGTSHRVSIPPFLPEHAKLTIYEGGLNVPLIISGPSVPHTGVECSALVNTTDLFATVLDLAGVDLSAPLLPMDSVSLVPYLADPTIPSIRKWVYAEMFNPNGPGPPEGGRSAIRGERFKLIRTIGDAPDEFYDLFNDPFETIDLVAPGGSPLQGEAAIAFFLLERQLTGMPWGIADFR